MEAQDAAPGLARRCRALYLVAAASFLPALAYFYVGEEAIFPIASLEMWQRGEWLRQILYGADVRHNPLFNWLIMPLAALLGWEQVLAVTRALTVAATLGTGLTLFWLARRLYRDAAFAAFAALCFVTLADVLFYRGWLAYVDPLFGLLVFGSIATLWVACAERSLAWLGASALLLTLGFLAKALTAYVFYGLAALVLLVPREHRAFLLRPVPLALAAATLAFPAFWFGVLLGGSGQGGRMLGEVLAKLAPEGAAAYLGKFVAYPLEILLRLAPLSLLAGWLFWRGRIGRDALAADPWLATAAAIALANFLPYWLAPQSAARYLLPVYPLFALVFARTIWLARERALESALSWIKWALVLKFAFALALFPWYQRVYRGENYAAVAQQVMQRSAGFPIYSADVSASGLSVTAELDLLRLPAAPLTFPPQRWEQGFVLAHRPDPELGAVAERYRLGGNEIFLLCRGAACGR